MNIPIRPATVDLLETVNATRRPRLLLRAARIGTADYRRETDLRRVLRLPAPPPPGPATLRALIELEAELEARRTRATLDGGEAWRPSRHVEVMVALIAEARLLAAATAPAATAPPPRRLALARPA